MDASVIVSTYNKVEWLEKVLRGYACQDFTNFELIIADDGSRTETRELILGVAERVPFFLRHIWHPDEGYRRSVILNAAILASRGEYLIFSDGDCIPRKDFVRTHLEMAEPGRFLSGGSVYLSMPVSKRISVADVESARFADPGWLRGIGQRLGRHSLRLLPQGWRASLLDHLTPTRPTWNLNNASTWREWIFAANGMEAEMQYGGADRALGSRLENLGLRGKRVRFRAVLLHLDHDRPYKTKESITKNKEIRSRIVEGGETRSRDGLSELDRRKDSCGFLEFSPSRGEGSAPDWNPEIGPLEAGSRPDRTES